MTSDNLQHTIAFSNTSPNIGDTVTCTSTITNNDTAPAIFRNVFSADGIPFYTSPLQFVTTGKTVTVPSIFQTVSPGIVPICSDPVPLHSESLQGMQLFPPNNLWYARADTLPLDPRSAEYMASFTGDVRWYVKHPYNIVDNSVVPQYVTGIGTNSDNIPYPIPDDPLINPGGYDLVLIMINPQTMMMYDLYHAVQNTDGTWTASSAKWFDLTSNVLRPNRRTPNFHGRVRYDELVAGVINHAIQVTVPHTNSFIWGETTWLELHDPLLNYPPVGQRLRLKASVNISNYPTQAKIIAQAFKTYGAIITDQHGDNYNLQFIGSPDDRWNTDWGAPELAVLHTLSVSDFEAVDCSSLMVSADSMEAKTY